MYAIISTIRLSLRKSIYVVVVLITISIMCTQYSPRKKPRVNMRPVFLEKIKTVRDITGCQDRSRQTRIESRGKYVAYYNIVVATRDFKCHESITLTTQGDFTFLANLIPLVKRWNGPISVALYAPGHDFQATMDAIAYLRNCEDGLIKEFVTFHIFYEAVHAPKGIGIDRANPALSLQTKLYKCSKWKKTKYFDHVNRAKLLLYKSKKSLKYPINVARNIALESAQTHFVLAADLELRPSAGVIDKFLQMIVAKPYLEPPVNKTNKHVYAFAVFEIKPKSKVPSTKSELQRMFYVTKQVHFFHEQFCLPCHGIPDRHKWMERLDDDELDVFTSVKRQGVYKRWEPFYIGTHREPPFDERVTWEGGGNKMIQAFALCSLDYDIRVLDDVFLTHKPAKTEVTSADRLHDRIETSHLMRETIIPELQNRYGKREGCVVGGSFTQFNIK